jgi:uridine kinase
MAQASEFAKVLNRIQELVQSSEQIIALIDGPAGAGKTTLAKKIANSIDSVNVVHMDDLYLGWDNPLNEELYTRIKNQIIEPHLSKVEISHDVFDWHKNSFNSKKSFHPKKILVIEGVGSAAQAIRNFADLNIYIEVSAETGFDRVLDRDGIDISENLRKWQLMERIHFDRENTKRAADFLVNGSF